MLGDNRCNGAVEFDAMSTIDRFLRWSEKDRGRSLKTIERYRYVLNMVSEYADPLEASVDDIQDWWESRYEMSAATRANELSLLRTFYRWAARFDLRIDDPTRRLDLPKVDNALPRIVGREQFDLLLGEASQDAPELRRAYALGGYGGLRVSEAAALDWENVDLEHRRIYVRGKGNKERAVPINALLLDYLLPEREGNVLWAGEKEAMSAGQLQRRINRHMRKWGVNHTFHDFRKRAASIMLSRGANPMAVRKMFGWAAMDTVMHYAEVGDTELDKIAALLD